MTAITDLPNGYYQVQPGKLANAVVWFEMRRPPAAPLARPLRLVPVTDAERELCDALYTAVGTPWLWSRAAPAARRAAEDNHIGYDDGRPVGIVQFAGRGGPEVEISFFGLVPAATGAGLGRRLMAAALDLAWQDTSRVWLHTCNFDHPAALRFYQACGFVPYASGFEIMDDPRAAGALPPDAAPHVPLILPQPS